MFPGNARENGKRRPFAGAIRRRRRSDLARHRRRRLSSFRFGATPTSDPASLMEVEIWKMKRSCDHVCEWKDLHADIVGNIAERLSPVEYINLSRVCRTWKGALSGDFCLPKSPQAPWLMLANNDSENEEDPTSIRFLDVFTGTRRVYKAKSANYVAGNRVYVAGDGWLVTISPNIKDTTMVWNPLTNAEIYHFPSILTLPASCRRGPNKRRGAIINADLYENFYIGGQFVSKIKVFKSYDTDIMVAIAIYYEGKNIAFARPGDGIWTPLAHYDHLFVCDVALHQGCIYAVDSGGKVKRWHLITGSYLGEVKKTISPFGPPLVIYCDYGKYFTTYDNKLVMVWSRANDEWLITGAVAISGALHKAVFELDDNSMAWNLLTRLGGGALFVDLDYSYGNAMILNHIGLEDQIILSSPSYIRVRRKKVLQKRVRSYDLVLQNYPPGGDILPYSLSNHRRTLGWFMPTLSRS